MEDMKDSLDGNICRCTGYRPIFDAIHSFATDAPKHLRQKVEDIEDLVLTKKGFICPSTQKACVGECSRIRRPSDSLQFVKSSSGNWIKPETLEDLMAVLDDIKPDETYRLVAGNTGTGKDIFERKGQHASKTCKIPFVGVYKAGIHTMLIDVNSVPELATITLEPFNIGGGVALTDFIEALYVQSSTEGYSYATQMAAHLKKVSSENKSIVR